MAEARKCDRCHWFYEIPKEQQNKLKPYEMKGAYAKILLCDNNRDYPETVRWYDLCPNCVKQQPDEDHNSMAQKLKHYCKVSYLKDVSGLIDDKDAPVDKGKDIFLKLYEGRRRL